MRTRSETRVARNGATVEIGTVEFDGEEFAAMGSVVDPRSGILVGYVKGRDLVTWSGERITGLQLIGSARGFYGATIFCFAAEFQGYRYSGRGLGEGMIIRLRKGRPVRL